EAQDRDRRAGLTQEVERVLDAGRGARADDDEAGARRAGRGLRAREGHVVVERGDVLLEARGAARVARGELGAREAPGAARVVERRGQGLLGELGRDLDDHGETRGVEREEVRLVVGRALRDGEDLLAQQPLEVAVHDALRVGPEGSCRLGRLDQYGTLGVHLEEGHRGISCSSGTRPGRGRMRHSLRRRSSPSNPVEPSSRAPRERTRRAVPDGPGDAADQACPVSSDSAASRSSTRSTLPVSSPERPGRMSALMTSDTRCPPAPTASVARWMTGMTTSQSPSISVNIAVVRLGRPDSRTMRTASATESATDSPAPSGATEKAKTAMRPSWHDRSPDRAASAAPTSRGPGGPDVGSWP